MPSSVDGLEVFLFFSVEASKVEDWNWSVLRFSFKPAFNFQFQIKSLFGHWKGPKFSKHSRHSANIWTALNLVAQQMLRDGWQPDSNRSNSSICWTLLLKAQSWNLCLEWSWIDWIPTWLDKGKRWKSKNHCSSLAEEKGLVYLFKWRFGNFQKVWKFLEFGHYTKEFKPLKHKELHTLNYLL